jgi:hypothetical protein
MVTAAEPFRLSSTGVGWLEYMAKQAQLARRALSVMAAVLVGGGTWTAVAAASPGPSITTVAGNGTRGSSGDGGPAVAAELNFPTGLAEDLVGTLYFADTANNQVRKIVLPTTIHTDIVSTIAGTGAPGFGGDGGLATSADLRRPTGLAVDSHGDVYIADSGNNRIREINASGVISTFAGSGACGRGIRLGNDRPATKASLCDPTGIALDRAGDLFIADTGHNVVREVKTSGTIVPFAGIGRGGWNGDRRPAGQAMLDDPTGVEIDALGNVYIADTGNNEVRVVNRMGEISAFAGTGQPGFGGDGGPATEARLHDPTGLGVDPSGDVFISDTANNRVREVSNGIISTYAGTGRDGFAGDGGSATAAQLDKPTGQVASDGSAVYFADTGNQRIRGVFNGPPPVLPEVGMAILFPASVLLIVGGGIVVARRRRRCPATSGR